MDPDVCYRRWLPAVAEGEAVEAASAWGDLRDWLARGGFEPRFWSKAGKARFLAWHPRDSEPEEDTLI